jgi:hypothetical protein
MLSDAFRKVYAAGIIIFGNMSSSLKSLMNKMVQFKVTLIRFLHTHFFCSVYEFLVLTVTHNFVKGVCLKWHEFVSFGTSCLCIEYCMLICLCNKHSYTCLFCYF